MADLGTVSFLIDINGQPLVKELATDFDRVTVSEKKMSDATAKVMADFQRMKSIMQMVKTETDGAANSFQRFSVKELQQTAQRMQGFESVLANTRRGMGQMGMATQQVGYQVGDFLVQVQSGTNWMVAFGQQATQLVGILPSFAGKLGMSVSSLIGISTGLGIAIPLVTAIGAAFMRTGESSKNGAQGITSYADALKGLTEEIQKNEQAFLKAKFGVSEQNVADAKQQIEDLQDQIQAISFGGKYGAGAASAIQGRNEKAANEKKIADLQKQLDLLIHQENVKIGIAAAEEASRIQNLYKLQLLDEEQVRLENRRKLVGELLSTYTDVGGAVKTISEIDLKAVFEDAVPASSALYQFVSDTYTKMLNMSKFQPRDYSGFTYGGAFAESRTGGPSTPPDIKDKTDIGGVGGGAKTDPLAELQKQIALQEELNGKTEAEKQVRQALGESFATYSPIVIKGLEDQIQKQIELEDRLKEQQQIFDTVKTSMEDAFMGMVDGTKTAKDAFKSMAAAIIKELYNVLVVQQLVGSFDRATGKGAGITGFLGKALTGMFKADGGPVSAGQPYIVGERGPELIIPKSSGMVLTNGQTKAALGGVSNDNYVVHNNINVTGSDSVMVRQEIAKMIPQISSATKAAMIDAKRRGGQMGNAFR